jgi:hypothetical protein
MTLVVMSKRLQAIFPTEHVDNLLWDELCGSLEYSERYQSTRVFSPRMSSPAKSWLEWHQLISRLHYLKEHNGDGSNKCVEDGAQVIGHIAGSRY